MRSGRRLGHREPPAAETSPYLRQHADNPVDWYPWGDEAFAGPRPRTGRSSSPSATRPATGATSWPTSRSRTPTRRPTINAVVRSDQGRPGGTARRRRHLHGGGPGHDRPGGWPMTVFLTPDGRPFFGGTYFPPDDRHGHALFPTVLNALTEVWTSGATSSRTRPTSCPTAVAEPLGDAGDRRARRRRKASAGGGRGPRSPRRRRRPSWPSASTPNGAASAERPSSPSRR